MGRVDRAPVERPLARHLADLCREQARVEPDRPAVLGSDVALSYAELSRTVSRLAGGLWALGVRPGTSVGMVCTNRCEWLAVAIATAALGARLAAFNTFARAWDLEYMISHSRAEVLVTLDSFRTRDYVETVTELIPELSDREWSSERFPHLREVVVIGDPAGHEGIRRYDDLLATGGEAPDVATSATDDAFVLYTSGSTARPKAVPMQHYALIENGFQIGERMGLTADDRVFVPVPLFWAYGAINALPATLTHRATLVLQQAFDPEEALRLIERHRCTAAYTLPTLTNALLASPEFDAARTASLRTGLTLGTETDLERAADLLGIERICNLYGQTETYGNCCVTPCEWPRERRLTCQGPPLPRVSVRIVGPEDGAELPAGEVGEIHVRGYVARGYLDEASDAGAAFGDDGWFRTGDLGWLDDQGCMHFAARTTEMIKTGGINVAPSEVEEVIAMHPDVREVAVTGAPHERLGEVVVAFVVVATDAPEVEDALREFCRERVASYKVPLRVHVVDALPATDTGKLPRRELLELDEELAQRGAERASRRPSMPAPNAGRRAGGPPAAPV